MLDQLWSCRFFIASLLILTLFESCRTAQPLLRLNELEPVMNVGIPELLKRDLEDITDQDLNKRVDCSDTLIINGKNNFLMRAIKSEYDGEMIANQTLTPASVTADFKNVAERGGKVNISFDLRIPKEMFTRDWQIRLYPTLYLSKDTIHLDKIFITGDRYRSRQLRGYELYEKFLSTILDEGDEYFKNFVDQRNLEIFIERNLPELFKLKSDSALIEIDNRFISDLGVTYNDVLDHYTKWRKLNRNRERRNSVDEKFAEYVKSPIQSDNIRLDTLLNRVDESFLYRYKEVISIKGREKKIVLKIDGDIWLDDSRIYTIPTSAPLTYYVSSLSSLIDDNLLKINHINDSLYFYGIRSLELNNYKDAINALKDYKDYNTALAYLSLEYNQSAESILKVTPRSDKVHYLLAIVYARLGKETLSKSHFWRAVEINPSLKFRANLDPELSEIVSSED